MHTILFMSGEPMTNLKSAAKRFCEQIFKAKETNYVAVVSYGTYTNIRCAFMDSYDETASAVDRIYLTGSKNITGAINTADNLLKEVQDGDNIIKNIVLCPIGFRNAENLPMTDLIQVMITGIIHMQMRFIKQPKPAKTSITSIRWDFLLFKR